jgi:hypothetical protein
MIHLNPGRIGVEAAEILAKVLSGEGDFKGDLTIETGTWIERGTLGPAPTRSLSQAG